MCPAESFAIDFRKQSRLCQPQLRTRKQECWQRTYVIKYCYHGDKRQAYNSWADKSIVPGLEWIFLH